jgi:predicted metal-dependent HD superfamily phosphohydrolase
VSSDAITAERIEQLQAAWIRLLGSYDVSPAAAYPIFDRLMAAYSESHRHYHNLEHISEMLRVVSRLADLTTGVGVVQLAVWFHDVVYNSRAKDNEERSAARAVAELNFLPSDMLEHIRAMILATRHTTEAPIDADTAVLLDADLAMLGAEERRYDRYASAIRQEYAWVEEAPYREGRSKVLDSFLLRPRIFCTQRMFEVGESAARANLRRELDRLRSG